MDRKTGIQAEIALLIYPDCQLAAVYGLTDLFRIAGDWAAQGLDRAERPIIRVSHWKADEHPAAGGEGALSCIWDSHEGMPHKIDYVITPPSIVMPEKMQPMPASAKWLAERHAEGSRICSVCAGAFVLAESGLLKGRRITTHWAFAKELAGRYPAVDVAEENIVLDDGDIVTAGGILAWADLGLTLVERVMGPSIMLATARFLLIDPPRKSQQPFKQFIPSFDHGDAVIVKVQHRIHAEVAHPQNVKDMASDAGLTERTFLRRFAKVTGMRPTEYVQQVRIAKARETLELTNQPVDRIAWQVGYQDPSAFRRIFQRLTGLTPNAFRQRFGVI
jgi:transcriptional regulator GlxA family with amidase domain